MFNDGKDKKENRPFQPGFDTTERRRQRENDRLRLRKETRQQLLKKRRLNRNSDGNNYEKSGGNNRIDTGMPVDKLTQQMLDNLPKLVEGCMLNDISTNFKCCQRIRRLLSIQKCPPIQQVIDSSIIPRLIQFCKQTKSDKLQFEALWALTNIASGKAEHTAAVIRNNAIPTFVNVMKSTESREVFEQSIWALGNIAGDSPECRNLVLKAGALDILVPKLKEYNNVSNTKDLTILRNATWTLSNFCRGQPSPPIQIINKAIIPLTHLLTNPDNEILQDAAWAFSYLSDNGNDNSPKGQQFVVEKTRSLVNCGAVARLVELLGHRSPHIQHPALRCIGNLVSSEDNELVQKIINMDLLSKMAQLLESDKPSIQKEACWTLSNLSAGNSGFIDAILDNNLFHILIGILNSNDSKFEIKKEAGWAISNATTQGNGSQIRLLVNVGCIPGLCSLLDSLNQPTIMVALEGLDNILKFGESEKEYNGGMNKPAKYVEECRGLDKLEELQTKDNINPRIISKAQNIVTNYFDGKREQITMNDTNVYGGESGSNGHFGGDSEDYSPETFKF